MSDKTDYEQFSKEVGSLIDKTPVRRAQAERGTSHKFKILSPEVGEIPVGSVVEVFAVAPDQLKHGDLVCLLKNNTPRIGRFLRNKGPHVVVARQGKPERLSSADVLGRVVRAVHGGRDFNPASQNIIGQLVGRLTDYGTFAMFRGA